MPWVQETSGVITLSSAGSWIANILNRSHATVQASSVGAILTTFLGSDRVQMDLILKE